LKIQTDAQWRLLVNLFYHIGRNHVASMSKLGIAHKKTINID